MGRGSERHLRQVLATYVAHYNGLGSAAQVSRPGRASGQRASVGLLTTTRRPTVRRLDRAGESGGDVSPRLGHGAAIVYLAAIAIGSGLADALRSLRQPVRVPDLVPVPVGVAEA